MQPTPLGRRISTRRRTSPYENNLACTVNLLKAMVQAGVRKIVFSSTAAVYGHPLRFPIEETDVCAPINPYGRTKWMSEMMIQDYCRAHKIGYATLRYFNVAGAWPDGEMGEDHQPETHLIPRILHAALHPEISVRIYGTNYPTVDGTCIRDYVHVVDIAHAHRLALLNVTLGEGHIFNLGSESGFSVRQVIEACETVTGRRLNVIEEARRPGDPAVLIASSEKIRSVLKWKRLYPSIHQILEHAWRWHSRYPQGYRSKVEKSPPIDVAFESSSSWL